MKTSSAGPGPSTPGPAARSPLFFIGVALAVLMLSGVLALWRSRRGAAEQAAETAAPRGNALAEAVAPAASPSGPPRFAPAVLEKDGQVRVVRSRAYRRREREEAARAAAGEGPTLARPDKSEGPPRTPAVIAKERELRQRLEALTKAYPAVQIGFADCGSKECIGRVQSASAAEIDRFAESARQSRTFEVQRVRERLTAFHGRLWEVDLVPVSTPTATAR